MEIRRNRTRTCSIVVAQYKENIDWISKVPEDIKVFVYTKSDVSNSVVRTNTVFKTLPNVGREAHTYIHHIVYNYESLTDTVIFLQGDPFEHAPDVLKHIAQWRAFMPVHPLTHCYKLNQFPTPGYHKRHLRSWNGYLMSAYPIAASNMMRQGIMDLGVLNWYAWACKHFNANTCWQWMNDMHLYNTMKTTFDLSDVPAEDLGIFDSFDTVHMCFGSMFSVTSENIQRHGLGAWKKLLSFSALHSNAAYIFECYFLTIMGFDHEDFMDSTNAVEEGTVERLYAGVPIPATVPFNLELFAQQAMPDTAAQGRQVQRHWQHRVLSGALARILER